MSKKKQTSSRIGTVKPGSQKITPAKKISPSFWLGIVVLAAVVLGAIVLATRGTTSNVQAAPAEISVSDAYQKYQQGAFFLDVRTPEEWNEYHAPNSTLIPLDQLPQRVNELPKDREIVVVCRSGNRSQEGRDILKQAGITNVTSMAGGLKAWVAAGYPSVAGP